MATSQYPEKLINRSVVPMFRNPDSLSEHVSQALLGQTVVETLGLESWRQIQTPDGYEGWVASVALSEKPAGWAGEWAEVDDLWANLRAQPDSRLAPITQAPIGTHFPIVGRQEGWIGLLLPDGRHGWSESKRVLEVGARCPRPTRAPALIRTAKRFLGIPYLWGGKSPIGLDCSGFVQTVYRLHDVPLFRDAHQQATQGVDAAVPAAGDLAFFHGEVNKDRITHVAMMLTGERFIHAAGSDCVRIDSLSDERYRPRLRCFRRYL